MDKFERYQAVLKPAGFYPALGFPNAAVEIRWDSPEEYLIALDSKTRLKFRNRLKLEEKFDVQVECVREFAPLAGTLAKLWKNVNDSVGEYSREQLDEKFFRSCSEVLGERCEAFVFRHDGRIIAFMLNLIGDEDYIVLDWGLDYDFAHYRQSNLYRSALLLSQQRAIELGKRRMEPGITNYTPKMTLGAAVEPLVYFVRQVDNPRFAHAFAQMLADSIAQPDNASHAALEKLGIRIIDIPAAEARLKRERNRYGDHDAFNRVGRYFRSESMRLGGCCPASARTSWNVISFRPMPSNDGTPVQPRTARDHAGGPGQAGQLLHTDRYLSGRSGGPVRTIRCGTDRTGATRTPGGRHRNRCAAGWKLDDLRAATWNASLCDSLSECIARRYRLAGNATAWIDYVCLLESPAQAADSRDRLSSTRRSCSRPARNPGRCRRRSSAGRWS